MEQILLSKKHTISEIDAVYKQTLKDIETQTALYLKNVQTGKNTKELEKWNSYVIENLNIDNIKLLGIENK